jgi:hypothetical protein
VKNIIPKGFAERLVADDLRSAEEALSQQIGTGIEQLSFCQSRRFQFGADAWSFNSQSEFHMKNWRQIATGIGLTLSVVNAVASGINRLENLRVAGSRMQYDSFDYLWISILES